MEKRVIGAILLGLVVFIVLYAVLNSQTTPSYEYDSAPPITGNAVNTPQTYSAPQKTEQIVIDKTQFLKPNMYYSYSFEVNNNAKVSISVSSDEAVDFALLPENEVDHYTKQESTKRLNRKTTY